MSNLESIVSVTITSNSRGISRKSFGIPLVVGKHDNWGQRFKVYTLGTALADLVSDGFTTFDPIYKAVQSIASNTPKPQNVAVGRLVTSFDQLFELVVQTSVTVGDVYAFTLIAPDGAETSISYTAQVADTSILVAVAIAALIDAVTDITAAVPATPTVAAVADNPDEMWRVSGINDQQFAFEDTTVDTNLAAEVGEINTLYPAWYGLILADPQSNARALVLAAFTETLEKMCGITSYNHDNLDPVSTTSLMYLLNAAQYFRTYAIFSNDQKVGAGATWMGNRFPFDPGSSTWAYKPLSGVTVDILTTDQTGSIDAVKGNYYVEVADLPVTQPGKMAAGEWIDVIRFRDWLVSRIREAVFTLLANAPKVPYTDTGVAMVTKEIAAVLQEGIGVGGLAATPAPFVAAPLVADVSDADKIARILPDIYFEATLAGAIHTVQIAGVLKV